MTSTAVTNPSYHPCCGSSRWKTLCCCRCCFCHSLQSTCLILTLLWQDFIVSVRIMASSPLNLLLYISSPLLLLGSFTHILNEELRFLLAGLALIPCAERLSLVTEQVASHTNPTIGALLNASFGNAPELLISSAALRAGFHRLVQLTLLGSMLTNLLFVFGLASFIGGLRWQVQQIRITSGNINIAMLMVAFMGVTLPALFILFQEGVSRQPYEDQEHADTDLSNVQDRSSSPISPSDRELTYSRLNSILMIIIYFSYLLFQLKTHQNEYEEPDHTDVHSQSPRHGTSHENTFCLRFCFGKVVALFQTNSHPTSSTYHKNHSINDENENDTNANTTLFESSRDSDLTLEQKDEESAIQHKSKWKDKHKYNSLAIVSPNSTPALSYDASPKSETDAANPNQEDVMEVFEEFLDHPKSTRHRSKPQSMPAYLENMEEQNSYNHSTFQSIEHRQHLTYQDENNLDVPIEEDEDIGEKEEAREEVMSLTMGLLWLALITFFISSLSDVLVDTIDGFAQRSKLSQVFTSVIIIPYFSNIAEQVSAVIFAFRNEMDLCIGVTIGSAVQVALFVLPGSVLVGWCMDSPMSLYLHGFETSCFVLAVLCIGSVIQGGTTNWMVGMVFMGLYFMVVVGFWFHEDEQWSGTTTYNETSSESI